MKVGMTRSSSEFGRRADAAYDRFVAPNVKSTDANKFVALDVDGGDYEIDADELAAIHRLRARRPDAAVWLVLVGQRYAHKLRSRRRFDAG